MLAHAKLSCLPQLLSESGEYKEAMELLKKALKLEPATKVRLCGVGHQHRATLRALCTRLVSNIKTALQHKVTAGGKCFLVLFCFVQKIR